MAYIHTKQVGNKKYYTLRISVRNKNGKVVTKDIENLGNDLNKINLENLEKKHKKEIKKSYKTINNFIESNGFLEKIKGMKLKNTVFLKKSQLLEIEAAKLHFEQKFNKLDKLTKAEIYELFLIKFAVNSTSIEGNTITLKEANKLFKEKILPKNKTFREVCDLQNTKKVFFEMLEKKPEITIEIIEKMHDDLLDNIDVRKGFRTHDIRILGQPFSPSPARYVKADLKILLDWFNKSRGKIHPFELGIFFHHKFESIHPFSDGNGRTGRMLLNLMLIRENYPPININIAQRQEYLESMNNADKAIKKDILNTDIELYARLFSFAVEQYNKTYWNTFLV